VIEITISKTYLGIAPRWTGQKEPSARNSRKLVDVREGSKPEVSALPRYVCSTPQSRHQLSRLRRPLRAIPEVPLTFLIEVGLEQVTSLVRADINHGGASLGQGAELNARLTLLHV
jgi:hypothetical protein